MTLRLSERGFFRALWIAAIVLSLAGVLVAAFWTGISQMAAAAARLPTRWR